MVSMNSLFYDKDAEFIKNPKGHVWILDEDGDVDMLAFEIDYVEGVGGHNGPKCSVCHEFFCHHCQTNIYTKCLGNVPQYIPTKLETIEIYMHAYIITFINIWNFCVYGE